MFKALLFLGAGSIIHAVHSNEMSAMGGLRKYMPITHITFLIACLAIAGIPPFSGFFSKDEILTACFSGISPVMGWIMTVVIAAMTAFYMFRLYYGIFWVQLRPGQKSASDGQATAISTLPHESPLTMTVPLDVPGRSNLRGRFYFLSVTSSAPTAKLYHPPRLGRSRTT